MILLDTDIMVDVGRAFPPAGEWLRTVANEDLAVPGFVAMELIDGCRTRHDQEIVLRRLASFRILWIDASGCEAAFTTFATLRLSHSLGLLDALIAQVALSHDLPLHTFNQKHFSAVPGLRTIQPYRK